VSRDRDDLDGEIILPGGMEIVVPPAARPTNPVEAADSGKSDTNAPLPRSQDGATRRPPAS
jgi:hypothetical protein